MIFASQGFDVFLYDVVSANVDTALGLLKEQLETLETQGLLRGKLTAAQQFGHVKKASTLLECVSDAVHIQVRVNPGVSFLYFPQSNTQFK